MISWIKLIVYSSIRKKTGKIGIVNALQKSMGIPWHKCPKKWDPDKKNEMKWDEKIDSPSHKSVVRDCFYCKE